MEPYFMEEKYYTEKDWKLFRSRLPGWQEAYMEKLNQEYIALLSQDNVNPSDKFWALEERINTDKKDTGVVARMARSRLTTNLISLMQEGAIGPADLEGFSDTLKEHILCWNRSCTSDDLAQQQNSREEEKENDLG